VCLWWREGLGFRRGKNGEEVIVELCTIFIHTYSYTHTHILTYTPTHPPTDSKYEPVESTMKRFNNLYGKPVIPFYRTTLYELVQVGLSLSLCVCLWKCGGRL
jgi:hypothetical protein